MNSKDIIICLICVILIVGCFIILDKSRKNVKLLKRKYLKSRIMFCLDNCGDDVVKGRDFFLMHNDGKSVCEPIEDIPYIDYIEDSAIFVKERVR